MADSSSPAPPARSERRVRTALIVGSGALLAGIAFSVGDDDLGRWLVVGGLVAVFVALHRFGRLGPEG